jgi:hypothetical protein
MARESKMKKGNEIEQERYRITINFSKEEFEVFKEASDMLQISPGKLIKESLLSESVTTFLKVLIANKQNIYKVIETYQKCLEVEKNGK